jgi:hypothetical protein
MFFFGFSLCATAGTVFDEIYLILVIPKKITTSSGPTTVSCALKFRTLELETVYNYLFYLFESVKSTVFCLSPPQVLETDQSSSGCAYIKMTVSASLVDLDLVNPDSDI